MASGIANEHIALFRSLFRGRNDVFAIRWEKENKAGYMPAYNIDWEAFTIHKAKGGTFKDFDAKQYSALTDADILDHLNGNKTIGIYPLLIDNSSWFIAADFDENNWMEECLSFIRTCKNHNIPAYLERSRSGAGGHVWIFFDREYPSYKSRWIIRHLLKEAGIPIVTDRNSSFDRLFPNQDYHSGKGLGNLIALPLQRQSLEVENACFLDIETLSPYSDQWDFLASIEKVALETLDAIYEMVSGGKPILHYPGGTVLQITLNRNITIHRQQLDPNTVLFLQKNLQFSNADFFIRQQLGKNTFKTARSFNAMRDAEGLLSIPRGFIRRLLTHLKSHNIPYELLDRRIKRPDVKYESTISLYPYQQQVLDATRIKELGVIVAPPGSGKTVMGLSIIADKMQPALIIVHRKQLFDQWVERVESFLAIPRHLIGKITDGEIFIGDKVTIATVQTLAALENYAEVENAFGTIIVDECHHMPARMFSETIGKLGSYYLYGFTATPIRKSSDEELIFINIGEVIHQVTIPVGSDRKAFLHLYIRATDLFVPFNFKTDKFETLSQMIIQDTSRNNLIIEDVKMEVSAGKRVLILTERKAHIAALNQYLKNAFETITLTGEDSEANRKSKLGLIEKGDFQILIATGQFIGEGADMDLLDCLFLAYPFAFEGKLIQYIGRLQRGPAAPVIYDYRDIKIEYLEKMFRQRNVYYKKLLAAGQILPKDELLFIFEGDKLYINSRSTALSINSIDFPMAIDGFSHDVTWQVRVSSFHEEANELLVDVINYDASSAAADGLQTSLQFLSIEKIRFRSIDTNRFLKVAILKGNGSAENRGVALPVFKRTLEKTMKVPISRLQFLHAGVAFPIYIAEVDREVRFEVANADIRPEFEVLKDYFSKILRKKLVTVKILMEYGGSQILRAEASSDDINSINASMIEAVRFGFIKKEVFDLKGTESGSTLTMLDELIDPAKRRGGGLFTSDMDFIDSILNAKKWKHYLQLKYLAVQHLSSVLKVRFLLQPFSFVFLLAGEHKYHLVWETLDTEDATYIWHVDKSKDVLRKELIAIDKILAEIRLTGKKDYLKNDHENFSRILHDYSDAKKGFVQWKGLLEERLL